MKCEFDVTPEIKEETNRILAECEKNDQLEYTLCMLEQSLSHIVNSPALAAHYIGKAGIKGIVPAKSAHILERLYLLEALERLDKREAAAREASDETKALMGICTAAFGK